MIAIIAHRPGSPDADQPSESGRRRGHIAVLRDQRVPVLRAQRGRVDQIQQIDPGGRAGDLAQRLQAHHLQGPLTAQPRRQPQRHQRPSPARRHAAAHHLQPQLLVDASLLESFGELQALQKKIHDRLKSVLGLETKVTLVSPKSLERFQGKAKRVLDLRNQPEE